VLINVSIYLSIVTDVPRVCVRWIHTAQNCSTDRHAIRCADSRGLKEQRVGYGRYSHHWKGHLVEHTYTCGGNVTSAGWQVTLRDPMWHVSSRSELLYTCYLLLLTYLGRGVPAIDILNKLSVIRKGQQRCGLWQLVCYLHVTLSMVS